MSGDQNQYIADQERKIREGGHPQGPGKQTMEMVELERQGAALPAWQQWVVNGLAVVGGLSILYLIADKIF
jgi:hypothetical protein